MPIYAYRCAQCGHAQDVLQKLSDPVLTVCPSCGAEAYQKQVTAAGFQLKGSGWYVTDFRGGNNPPGVAKPDAPPSEGDKPASGDAPAAEKKPSDAAPAPAAATPAKPATPAAPAAPTAGSGS